MDLFDEHRAQNLRQAQPLAARMRPRSLDEFIGQEHFFGPGKLLRRMLQADRLGSPSFMVRRAPVKLLSPTSSPSTRSAIFGRSTPWPRASRRSARCWRGRAPSWRTAGRRTILFVDELHRFNRAQQDVLLPDVEEGRVILIGATTQNPFFAINSPLLSRSQIFTFQPLTREQIKTLIQQGPGRQGARAGKDAVNMRPRRPWIFWRRCATAMPGGH